MKHVFGAYNSDINPHDDPFHPFTPDEWSQQTSTMFRTYLIQNLPDPHGPEPVPSGPIFSSRPTAYSAAAIEQMGFKKGIKSEIAVYPSLKDERYFDGFKRSLFIVAKSHECNEVLDPTYTPDSEHEEQELFLSQMTRFYQCHRLCSCGTKPQHSENHHFVMTSSWEPQCHHDIIMRTPRITGKPKFSCSGGL